MNQRQKQRRFYQMSRRPRWHPDRLSQGKEACDTVHTSSVIPEGQVNTLRFSLTFYLQWRPMESVAPRDIVGPPTSLTRVWRIWKEAEAEAPLPTEQHDASRVSLQAGGLR